jgi:hypothetical protein
MSGKTLGKLVIVLVWVLLVGLVASIGLELFLKLRWEKRREVKEVGLEYYDQLRRAYHPFAIQHVNPNYLFFFPFEPKDRVALSNQFVSLDSAGFRGPGPEYSADRELAFLLGGSTAFSFSSSDSTSITGFLNRLQDRYFFVNAGVPSWNSTQEMFRLVNQVLAYDPALVVTFDGANDLAILVQYHEKGLDFPPGTPESFGLLQELVGDIRARSRRSASGGLFRRFFPNLVASIAHRLSPPKEAGPIATQAIEQVADKYVANLELMSTITEASGGTFMSFFQPIIWLHQNGPEKEEQYKYRGEYEYYHDRVLDDSVSFLRFDLADMFDDHFDVIPYFDPAEGVDIGEHVIFLDPVHFFDTGNRMVAQAILDGLRSASSASALDSSRPDADL